MVLLFYMKQILILVRIFFVELIYLSGDLRTINCHINLLGYYHLRWRSVPPVSASICRPYFPCFSRRTPPHFYSIAWVFLSLSVRPVDQQGRQLAVRFYPRWCYVRSGVYSVYQLGESGRAWTDFIPSRPKFSDQKSVTSDFFLSHKINLEDTLIFGGEYSVFPETQRTINQKLLLSSFICLC